MTHSSHATRTDGDRLVGLFERLSAHDAFASALDLAPEDLPQQRVERALLSPALEMLTRGGKAFRARLVELGGELGGGTDDCPPELSLIVELIHLGSLVVDDIEDGSTHRRGRPALHRLYGVPIALNTGNWLYFWPLEILATLPLPPARLLELQHRVTRTMVRCHVGQALDLDARIDSLAPAQVATVVRTIATLKTGSLVALAASVGAVATGAPLAHTDALSRFGRRFGVALQMLDDLGNLDGVRDPDKRHEDLRLGRATWVWSAVATRVPARRFAALQDDARRVREGALAPAHLAIRVRDALGADPRREPRRLLAHALDDLRTALGPDADVGVLAHEIARLEASYA